MNRKQKEVGSLHQLRHDDLAIIGGEGGVVDVSAIVVLETDEAGVFDAVALRGGGWKKDAFGQLLLGLELDLEVRPGQQPDSLRGGQIFLRHSIQPAVLLHFGCETGAQILQRERVSEPVHHPAGEFASQSQFEEFPGEQRLLIQRVGDLTRLGEEARGSQHLDAIILHGGCRCEK